jgi:hypothetical protein
VGQDRPLEAVDEVAQPDLLASSELGLIVGDLADRVDAEIALPAVADDMGEEIEVLARRAPCYVATVRRSVRRKDSSAGSSAPGTGLSSRLTASWITASDPRFRARA